MRKSVVVDKAIRTHAKAWAKELRSKRQMEINYKLSSLIDHLAENCVAIGKLKYAIRRADDSEETEEMYCIVEPFLDEMIYAKDALISAHKILEDLNHEALLQMIAKVLKDNPMD